MWRLREEDDASVVNKPPVTRRPRNGKAAADPARGEKEGARDHRPPSPALAKQTKPSRHIGAEIALDNQVTSQTPGLPRGLTCRGQSFLNVGLSRRRPKQTWSLLTLEEPHHDTAPLTARRRGKDINWCHLRVLRCLRRMRQQKPPGPL